MVGTITTKLLVFSTEIGQFRVGKLFMRGQKIFCESSRNDTSGTNEGAV